MLIEDDRIEKVWASWAFAVAGGRIDDAMRHRRDLLDHLASGGTEPPWSRASREEFMAWIPPRGKSTIDGWTRAELDKARASQPELVAGIERRDSIIAALTGGQR